MSRRWEYAERFPSTDEEAERLLSGAQEAGPCLEAYGEWRFGVGVGVEHALLRASELARELAGEERLREGKCRHQVKRHVCARSGACTDEGRRRTTCEEKGRLDRRVLTHRTPLMSRIPWSTGAKGTLKTRRQKRRG